MTMTKINEVSKGEGDWQRPVNSLIKLANSQVGGVRFSTLLPQPLS